MQTELNIQLSKSDLKKDTLLFFLSYLYRLFVYICDLSYSLMVMDRGVYIFKCEQMKNNLFSFWPLISVFSVIYVTVAPI